MSCCLSNAILDKNLYQSIINIIIILWFISLIITIFEKFNSKDNHYLVVSLLTMIVLYYGSIKGIIKTYNNCRKEHHNENIN